MSGFTITAGVSFSGGFTFTEAPVDYTAAWFGNGSIDRITYATDTNTASVRGPLSGDRSSMAAAGNTTDGWWGGGTSIVDRITWATDTATASTRGPLSLSRYKLAAASNISLA